MFHKDPNYLEINLKWVSSNDPEYPYQMNYSNHKLQVRLNDFPDEALYSLIVDGEVICDFDDWPKNWIRYS